MLSKQYREHEKSILSPKSAKDIAKSTAPKDKAKMSKRQRDIKEGRFQEKFDLYLKKNEHDVSQFFEMAELRKQEFINSNRNYNHKPEGSELSIYTEDKIKNHRNSRAIKSISPLKSLSPET